MTNEHIISESPSHEAIAGFEKMLGVGKVYTPEYVLKCFEITHSIKEENGELEDMPPYMEAKTELIRHLVSSQMKAQRYFEIVSPFKDSCVSCRGAGEIFKFNLKEVIVNCHICAGKKTIKVKCAKCKGTGRFKKKWKSGGGIDVTCKLCNGKGSRVVSCLECGGHGKKMKLVKAHTLKSTTPCKHCDGLGFTKNKPKLKNKIPKPSRPPKSAVHFRKPDNPVLTSNLAEQIKTSIVQSESTV